MTADKGIIDAGARKVRHGNGYNAATGARETALNKAGAPTPAMEVFRFPSTEALTEAAKDYPGNVTVIWNNGAVRRVETKESDEGPIDFFKELDDGTVVRCDKNGNVSTELEHLEPNNTGVVATGSTTGIGSGEGGTSVPPAAPGTRVQFKDHGKPAAPWPTDGREYRLEATGIGPGVTAGHTFIVPLDAVEGGEGGRISIAPAGEKSPGNPVNVRVTCGDRKYTFAAADMGGAPTLSFVVGNPDPKHPLYVKRGEIGTVECDVPGLDEGKTNDLYLELLAPQ